jgi:hydroxymethylbilane synthase
MTQLNSPPDPCASVSIRGSSSLHIATRGSALALWQAQHVASLIEHAHPGMRVELVEVSTTGDRVQSQPLRDFGGQGAFTREIQAAVLDGRADVAVHSLKDLPTEPTPGLKLAAVPARGATDDALVLPSGSAVTDLKELPHCARVGTGSPRRQAQLRFVRPDLQTLEVRGNVETRVRKLDAGEFDALVLAAAGLIRLGLEHRITQRLTPPLMYAAVSQGAIGIECRSDDESTSEILSSIRDPATWGAVIAERTLLAALRAGCHAPVGVATTCEGDQLRMEAVVLPSDGSCRWEAMSVGSMTSPAAIGEAVADQLLAQGAARVLSPPQ